jgi:hypothetical protein
LPMPNGALLDNDVVLKTCCYATVDDMLTCLGQLGPVAVLGVARFVSHRVSQRRRIL